MLIRLIRKLKLKIVPLKEGDVLMGNCIDFGMEAMIQQAWHGMRTLGGQNTHKSWKGDDTYRLTLISSAMPSYYRFSGEVLTYAVDEDKCFEWKKSSIDRRILKSRIDDMILEGKLTRIKK